MLEFLNSKKETSEISPAPHSTNSMPISLNKLCYSSDCTLFQLASIAQQLDSEEDTKMAEGSAEEYSKYLDQPSGNMDDSGFFSVQVFTI